jgi:hypothetical protein
MSLIRATMVASSSSMHQKQATMESEGGHLLGSISDQSDFGR